MQLPRVPQLSVWVLVAEWGAPDAEACVLAQVSALSTLSSAPCCWTGRKRTPVPKRYLKYTRLSEREASPTPNFSSTHSGAPASLMYPLTRHAQASASAPPGLDICCCGGSSAGTKLSGPHTCSSAQYPQCSRLPTYPSSSLGSPEPQGCFC